MNATKRLKAAKAKSRREGVPPRCHWCRQPSLYRYDGYCMICYVKHSPRPGWIH